MRKTIVVAILALAGVARATDTPADFQAVCTITSLRNPVETNQITWQTPCRSQTAPVPGYNNRWAITFQGEPPADFYMPRIATLVRSTAIHETIQVSAGLWGEVTIAPVSRAVRAAFAFQVYETRPQHITVTPQGDGTTVLLIDEPQGDFTGTKILQPWYDAFEAAFALLSHAH
jgi:hypothetical protein